MDHRFRFEAMEIWKRAADASDILFDFAAEMKVQKRYEGKFDAQLDELHEISRMITGFRRSLS